MAEGIRGLSNSTILSVQAHTPGVLGFRVLEFWALGLGFLGSGLRVQDLGFKALRLGGSEGSGYPRSMRYGGSSAGQLGKFEGDISAKFSYDGLFGGVPQSDEQAY